MQRYRNPSGTSGITGYESGPDFICIEYERGGVYVYTEKAVGRENLEQMKRLAIRGSYLNAFINRTPAIRRGGVKVDSEMSSRHDKGADIQNPPLHFES